MRYIRLHHDSCGDLGCLSLSPLELLPAPCLLIIPKFTVAGAVLYAFMDTTNLASVLIIIPANLRGVGIPAPCLILVPSLKLP